MRKHGQLSIRPLLPSHFVNHEIAFILQTYEIMGIDIFIGHGVLELILLLIDHSQIPYESFEHVGSIFALN